MSYYPTGMSPATGNHYHNVAAQMQAYLNNGSGHFQSGSHGLHQYQGHQTFYHGAHHFGVNPMIANDAGGFARRFMRNLFI
ncbi:unnamed protein product [Rotaria sp. Silwood2]|nr:unnamed protein product [Rotaria sp. Silwood2]CAF2485191.1 unnamed protein product [Rotaria sp. Silwood2]CAF2742727.1 unnamed protein product [Rotaria sp. Silwood2]CAF2868579.1 unnamed protein product [Rotaria sp. Silwood2]CAF4159559.1 unnamed protein product [Rotaria sp. Silwood2]